MYKTIFSVLLILFISSCGNDEKANRIEQPQACSNLSASQSLFDYMQEWYFWESDLTEAFQPSAELNIAQTLNSLKVPQDRYSFTLTATEYQNYQNSIFFGYGFSFQPTENRDGLIIRTVYQQGSAAEKGLQRGDIITSVNQQSMADLIQQVDAGLISIADAFGPNEVGYGVDVTFIKSDGTTVTTHFIKSEIQANTVMKTDVYNLETDKGINKTGYLVFDSFDNRSEEELNQAFNYFSAEQVSELILDLRYNSGGLVRIAQQLSSHIVGQALHGEEFATYKHNVKQQSQNQTIYFDTSNIQESLNLDRVLVLTSSDTCSSSELVINALSAYIDVVTLGETTCGKPVGMYPEPLCEQVIFAINFQLENALDYGHYYQGLTPDCQVTEHITGDWGVETDPLLLASQHYLKTLNCPAQVAPFSSNSPENSKSIKRERSIGIIRQLDERYL